MKLRDLQGLLRHRFRNDELVVNNYTYESLLPIGENYGSTMLKVHVVYREHEDADAPQKELELVAKMMPPTDFQRSVFDSPYTFRKEAFLYQGLVPAYRQLEREFGVPEAELFDIVPGFYGVRYTLANVEADDGGFDEDAVILMENLKVAGYYTCDRKTGMDFAHAKMAISKLAEYHALGLAFRMKKPELFEEARTMTDTIPFDFTGGTTAGFDDHILKIICNDSRMAPYRDRIKQNLDKSKNFGYYNMEAVKPWLTITHGDVWGNNMMFKDDEDKNPIDIKFVDFQIAYACSPMKDIPYFLCTSLRIDTFVDHFDDLLDVYHNQLIDSLSRLQCDTAPFAREQFDEQLQHDASDQFSRCMLTLKFITMDTAENDIDLNDLKGSVVESEANDVFVERLWQAIRVFVEKDWM
ncbi:unnamed protein product [Trichogramma brassicae]|uniref:CHK kinase-like domain-containing protein n=1 Tax=Trichogramma brassicae TaxID=86971 RepID=A0A6H5IJD0_9HYME|nr:unnamed protein product [Trichogramma brassicae]